MGTRQLGPLVGRQPSRRSSSTSAWRTHSRTDDSVMSSPVASGMLLPPRRTSSTVWALNSGENERRARLPLRCVSFGTSVLRSCASCRVSVRPKQLQFSFTTHAPRLSGVVYELLGQATSSDRRVRVGSGTFRGAAATRRSRFPAANKAATSTGSTTSGWSVPRGRLATRSRGMCSCPAPVASNSAGCRRMIESDRLLRLLLRLAGVPWRRRDVIGQPHSSSCSVKYVPTPHLQGPRVPGGVRLADPWEIPRGLSRN